MEGEKCSHTSGHQQRGYLLLVQIPNRDGELFLTSTEDHTVPIQRAILILFFLGGLYQAPMACMSSALAYHLMKRNRSKSKSKAVPVTGRGGI
jgi:hypothetical protein